MSFQDAAEKSPHVVGARSIGCAGNVTAIRTWFSRERSLLNRLAFVLCRDAKRPTKPWAFALPIIIRGEQDFCALKRLCSLHLRCAISYALDGAEGASAYVG